MSVQFSSTKGFLVDPCTNATNQPKVESALCSVHTESIPHLLSAISSSLIVTTYQAGKVVLLRNENGVLNTHFRFFHNPMGLALDGRRLAIGGAVDIWEFENVPEAARRIEPVDTHDAAFLPRRAHVTGNVQIHEMAWVRPKAMSEAELWFVNTAFSCLSVPSDKYSFEPRWRPTFISHLQPGDCCHLNGLAVREGEVRYVTALGESNSPGGWRENKRDGGLLIDIQSNETISRGLSMPHSPRWYKDQLWILDSGTGGFGRIELSTGRYEEITRLPGFTRGMTFAGDIAFIGLSQVREKAIFSGIPLCDELPERSCGIWAIDITTGRTVGFVKFDDGVREIFAVELLSGLRWPDLMHENSELISSTFQLPDETLRDVPLELRDDIRHSYSNGNHADTPPAY